MHLKSISMKGFKSFPQRTRLDFAPGVSVVVGPNGSGKSNITDAVLWALGEQSPLAVRGQTMKDVIFAGGHGIKGSSAAEVEVVIDNSEGGLASEFSEISIVRRLDRSSEGEYRLNGARCRLVDVLEVLSDSGLGKEMHSVVSQGKVEAIVLSRPRDRRLLIEEAAGLGKHRKRRRRAQLKLERTADNLARALDVEREARSRLRPLKRQAEAAELHARIERQSLEARLELSKEGARQARADLAEAEGVAAVARAERDEAERLLGEVAARRVAAEQAFEEQARAREQLQSRVFAARSASERIELRLERARDQAAAAAEGAERRRAQLEVLDQSASGEDAEGGEVSPRVAELEAELQNLHEGRERRVREELAELEAERAEAERRRAELQAALDDRREALEAAERAVDAARSTRRDAERRLESARAAAADAGAGLAAVNQFLRASAEVPGGALSDSLEVEPGYERALAAVLGPRLGAGVVEDLRAGQALLDSAGDSGGIATVASRVRGRKEPAGQPGPAGAEPLAARVSAGASLGPVLDRLLSGVWVVESLEGLGEDFVGVAVTRGGRLLDASTGELAQAPAGGGERLLEERRRRDELAEASARALAAETEARTALELSVEAVAAADGQRDEAETALRRAARELEQVAEAAGRAEWLIERRREHPDGGPEAVRRAELTAELRAEHRLAEQRERDRRARATQRERLAARIEADDALAAAAERASAALEAARDAVSLQRSLLERSSAEGVAAGEETATTLRACAHEEAELQARLKRASDTVTTTEVAAQQVRDAARDADAELREIAGALGLEGEPPTETLPDERRLELEARVERLARRREQLGPVNPLAEREYEEAVAHVEELETQRRDLESALAELEGLIKDTDRRIRESFEQTFEAAARNFEDVVQHLFPGGRGRLRLVQPEGPRPVIGGEETPDAVTEAPGFEEEPAQEVGVEVEVTPAGKSMKRLSLLSGGEKSLVALAFMFAVFLARPCPFYILDEVEAALDDLNIDRFLQLVRRYSDRAQFIVVTHQKRTMDAADRLYGVSMGGDGVSRVVSRKLAAVEEAA